MRSQSLVFEAASGTPIESLQVVQHDIPQCSSSQILVKMLAAPVNPLDLLVLRGQYPVKPHNLEQGKPIPGYDGVAEIVQCGADVVDLQLGDKVIIKRHGLGTWRTHAILNAGDVSKVPSDLEPKAAAILRMGVLTAWLLLENNISKATAGEWIIVNAATGVIAHFLSQFAAAKGLRVIAVIRDREQAEQTKMRLRRYGADIVISETEMSQSELLRDTKISLGFDAVFGASGQELISTLSPGATYVAYGFLGGLGPDANITINQDLIFLKRVIFKGFRLSEAMSSLKAVEERALYALFTQKLRAGELAMPMLSVVCWDNGDAKLQAVRSAIREANGGRTGLSKTIIMFP